MVQHEGHELSVVRQCSLLQVSRSGLYYKHRGKSDFDLSLMREIDRIFTAQPSMGTRQLRGYLNNTLGYSVGRKRVRRLMNFMGLRPIYQAPRTSTPHPEHIRYPYLLRNMTVTRINQVWCTDITYIPMKKGFLYLAAVMDWYSRKILSWRLSNTMDVDLCLATVEDALAKYGKPDIFNTDQGSQFTSAAFTGLLTNHGIRISMDGKGSWVDNVFIERFWRSLKYENVYLHNYETGVEARKGIGRWIRFYNELRPHSSIGGIPPSQYYAKFLGEAA